MTSQPGEEATVELPGEVERPEDDDHDLLTFGEAGARLEIEIRTLRARLRELEEAQPRDEAAIAQAADPARRAPGERRAQPGAAHQRRELREVLRLPRQGAPQYDLVTT